MFRPRHVPADTRRGVILLVVLSLLTLFAIVGISFVLYANSHANSSRFAREGEAPTQPDMEPEMLLSFFLSQLIFDADDINGVYSAMRGHSLARTMYGLNGTITTPQGALLPQVVVQNTDNIVPYSGVGRVHWQDPTTGQMDDYNHVNYTWFLSSNPQQNEPLRDPEHYNRWRTSVVNPPYTPKLALLPYNRRSGYIAYNAPYTYPDLNNMFLAAVKAGPITFGQQQQQLPPGVVLMPSFHRPWLFGSWDPQNPAASNPNWTNGEGKYLILRPRPAEMTPNFPYPEDLGGDVKNLPNSPGTLVKDAQGNLRLANNDSFWMDLGAPVMIAPDGTKYKPLFASLILDLDGRVNLNVHGNLKGQGNQDHASNQGWGPWEVNLKWVLDQPPTVGGPSGLEWYNLFAGLAAPPQLGRYGPDRQPTSRFPGGNTAEAGTAAHWYGPVDFDGCVSNQMTPFGPASDKLNLTWKAIDIRNPTQMYPGCYNGTDSSGAPQYFCPNYPCPANGGILAGYDNGSFWERQNHPLLYNFFNPQADPTNPNNYDLAFPISNMEALLRYGDTNSPGLTSTLYRLCNNNFDPNSPSDQNAAVNAPKRRNLVTTHSFNLDRAGATPWVYDPTDANSRFELVANNGPGADATQFYPKANPIPFDVMKRLGPGGIPRQPPQGSEYGPDWRAITSGLTKVDLNRKLAPYPINPSNPFIPFNQNQNLLSQFNQATSDRIQFATDIYLALVAATGAYPPFNNQNLQNPTTGQLQANRWLAQLAVNIVDYIDNDDIMTPFPWARVGNQKFTGAVQSILRFGTTGPINPCVFGTEMPRVVMNEVYAEFAEQPQGMPSQRTYKYNIDFWVELYNPLRAPLPNENDGDPLHGNAVLQMPPRQTGGGPTPYAVYQMVIVQPKTATYDTSAMRDLSNVLGDFPNEPAQQQNNVVKTVNITGSSLRQTIIQPAGGQFSTPNGTDPMIPNNLGFYMLGPSDPAHPGMPKPFPKDPNKPPPDSTYPTSTNGLMEMSFQGVQFSMGSQPNSSGYVPLLLLRRLACPWLPFNGNPSSQGSTPYNPYVTVDYWRNFTANLTPNAATDTSPGTWQTNPPSLPVASRVSMIRNTDPYCAAVVVVQTLVGQDMSQPRHSMFRHNSVDATKPSNGLGIPFHWLAHMDRQLISPLELLNVSAWKPHELTQQFQNPTDPATRDKAHTPHWFDQRTRLYRAFELLETHPWSAGTAIGGRIPGQVNLNTVNDIEILRALCDAQPSNLVYGNPGNPNLNVDAIFNNMLKLRNPNSQNQGQLPFGPNDRPFRPLLTGYTPPAQGQGPPATGINDTILRSADPNADGNAGDPGGSKEARLFQVPTQGGFQESTDHPYLRYQLLTKLFNNVTTRSNVFGVWVTVGFFKVEDDTTFPVKLGAEIGKAENRHVRHRMFAIVDRTNLTVASDPRNPNTSGPGGPAVFLAGGYVGPDPGPGPLTGKPMIAVSGATLNANNTMTGSYEGIPWTINTFQNSQINGTLVLSYGNSSQTGQTAEVVVHVAKFTPANPNANPPTPDTFTISDSFPTPPPQSSFPIRPIWSGKPGNPGPVTTWPNPAGGPFSPGPRFDPRAFPWVVRYFSVIN